MLSLPSPALPLLAKKQPLSLPDSSGVFITQTGEEEGETQSLIGFPLQIAGTTYWLRIRQSGESREGGVVLQAQLGAILLYLGLR